MKLRKVAIKTNIKLEKTKVLLADYDGPEEEEVMTEEVVLYGEATGFSNFQTAPQTTYQTGNRRFQRFRRGGQGGFQPRGGNSPFFSAGGQRQPTPYRQTQAGIFQAIKPCGLNNQILDT